MSKVGDDVNVKQASEFLGDTTVKLNNMSSIIFLIRDFLEDVKNSDSKYHGYAFDRGSSEIINLLYQMREDCDNLSDLTSSWEINVLQFKNSSKDGRNNE